MKRTQAEQQARSLQLMGRIEHPLVVEAFEKRGAVAAYEKRNELRREQAVRTITTGVVVIAVAAAIFPYGLFVMGGVGILLGGILQWVNSGENPYELAKAQEIDRDRGLPKGGGKKRRRGSA